MPASFSSSFPNLLHLCLVFFASHTDGSDKKGPFPIFPMFRSSTFSHLLSFRLDSGSCGPRHLEWEELQDVGTFLRNHASTLRELQLPPWAFHRSLSFHTLPPMCLRQLRTNLLLVQRLFQSLTTSMHQLEHLAIDGGLLFAGSPPASLSRFKSRIRDASPHMKVTTLEIIPEEFTARDSGLERLASVFPNVHTLIFDLSSMSVDTIDYVAWSSMIPVFARYWIYLRRVSILANTSRVNIGRRYLIRRPEGAPVVEGESLDKALHEGFWASI